jgi:hypothetical protein
MMRVRESSTSGRPSGRGVARGERGSALIVVLLVIAALSLLSVMGARTAQTELQITQKDVQTKQALSAAEAGLNHAYDLIKSTGNFSNELSSGGTGGTLAGIGSVATIGSASYRFRVFGGGSSDGYYVEAQDDFDETSGANDPTIDTNARIYLVSRGRVGGAERVVMAAVGGTTRFPYALFGRDSIILGGGAQTDSYDSRIAAYNAFTAGNEGDVRTNGDITVNGGTNIIHGDATQSSTSSIGDTVTGTKTTGAANVTAPCGTPPACGPPYSMAATVTGVSYSYNQGTGVLSATGSSAVITLASGTYCFSSITLLSGAKLNIAAGASVTINVTGAVDFGGGSFANPTGNPANLLLNSSCNGTCGATDGIVLTGNFQAYMAVYAPLATVKFSGGADFWGAVFAASVKNTGGTWLHYDQALQGLVCTTGISGWHEVRS